MAPHESDRVRTLDNGAHVIPAVQHFAPGSLMGMFTKNQPCEELEGRQMILTPGFENWWCDWRCKKQMFNESKRYEVTMRYKADADQEVMVYVYMGKDPPHYERSLEIPSTDGEWSSFKFLLETDIGGFKDSSMKWEIAKVQGEVFYIKDFTFAPPGSDETGEYSGPWFAEWLEDVKGKVDGVFPKLEDSDREALLEAANTLHEATGDTYNPFFLVPTALEVIRAAKDNPTKEALSEAREAFEQVALPLLEGMDEALDGLNLDSPEVLQYLVLVQATPTNLGAYCHEANDEQIERLMKLLKGEDGGTELLKQMILSGGAKGGHYGKALDIYYAIQDKMQPDKTILPKLQMACALVLCQPLAIFDTVTPVDGVERYFGYEKAYLDGMLDPGFEQFSVWELRMCVDADASNEELDWGREMLLAYRPDIAYMGDQTWRYSSLVKTDVKYTRPDWKPHVPRDMIQALSRGGKCGPRAFFGRFINKAFGNPTWGLLQPGHAALSKWTPTGWASCLGSDQGTKDGRDYRDFQFEVYMRKKMGDDFYCRKVEMLVWLQIAESNDKVDINKNFPSTPWLNLAAIQRKRFGDTDKPYPPTNYGHTGQCEIDSKISQIQQREEPKNEDIVVEDDGTIVIPSSAHHSSKNTAFAKSVDSGKQFNAGEMWWIEYRIPADKLPEERTTYNLTMRIACVHDKDSNPFQWIITSAHHSEQPMTEYSVPLKYTKGLWEETEPVEVTLGGGGEEKLKLMRQKPCLPISIKDFKLTPV